MRELHRVEAAALRGQPAQRGLQGGRLDGVGDVELAERLLERVRASQSAGWSGYVETEGTLQLPDADRFSDVGALFGESTALRACLRRTS